MVTSVGHRVPRLRDAPLLAVPQETMSLRGRAMLPALQMLELPIMLPLHLLDHLLLLRYPPLEFLILLDHYF